MPPLKRRKELQALSEDHHNALVIALRCKRLAAGKLSVELDEFSASVLEFFELQIVPHFEVEETLLLPALRVLGETAMAERIADEHERLRALIADGVGGESQLEVFGQLLEDHIRFEEREVFESVQDRLPAETLSAIRAASLEVPQICPTTFKPLPR